MDIEEALKAYDAYKDYNQSSDYLFIAQIIFAAIVLIGISLYIYAYYKKNNQGKKQASYIMGFGIIIFICLFLISKKMRSNFTDVMNNTYFETTQ